MAKAVVYALLATAFILVMVFCPSKQHGHHDHLGLNRRLGFRDHVPVFDPLVAKMERYAEENGLGGQTHNLDLVEHSPMMDTSEVEEVHEYFSDEGKLNLTLRLLSLFPLIDQAPKDSYISSNELKHWLTQQAVERLNYRTQKEMESYDKDGDGNISFSEYQPKFSSQDIST